MKPALVFSLHFQTSLYLEEFGSYCHWQPFLNLCISAPILKELGATDNLPAFDHFDKKVETFEDVYEACFEDDNHLHISSQKQPVKVPIWGIWLQICSVLTIGHFLAWTIRLCHLESLNFFYDYLYLPTIYRFWLIKIQERPKILFRYVKWIIIIIF